jgi:hypothetical protein
MGASGAAAVLASDLPPLARAGLALLVLAMAWRSADAWRARPPLRLGWSGDADAWWIEAADGRREALMPPRAFERWPLLQLEARVRGVGRRRARRVLLFVLPDLPAACQRRLRLALARTTGAAGDASGAGGFPGGLAG